MSSLRERQEQNVAVVRRVVAAFQRGDLDEIFGLAHPDFEVFLPPNLANAGRYVGQQGFTAWLNQWLEAWEGFTVELSEVEPVGEHHVVANMHQSARGKGSGVAVEMEIGYVWDVRDGRLAAMHLYTSRDEAMGVAEKREPEASP